MSNENERETIADESTGTARRVHTFSKYVLPSDRHAWEAQFEVLRRFVPLSRNGQEPIEAKKLEGGPVPVQGAQMNVRFMTDAGLLQSTSRGLYLPTPETIRFVNALSVGPERAKPVLRGIIEKTWFAELARTVLALRPVMSEDELISELALYTETDKARKVGALRILVEYLVFTGIVTRDERGLTLGASVGSSDTGSTSPSPTPGSPTSPAPRLGLNPPSSTPAGWSTIQTEDFSVTVKADEAVIDDLRLYLDALRAKIVRQKAAGGDSKPTQPGAAP